MKKIYIVITTIFITAGIFLAGSRSTWAQEAIIKTVIKPGYIPEGYKVSEDAELPWVVTQVSVQERGTPDINAYSVMIAAGIYYFPWLERMDTYGCYPISSYSVYVRILSAVLL